MKTRINPSYILPAASLALSAGILALVLLLGGDAVGVDVGRGGPAFRLGVSLTLTGVFGLVWLFGVRYADVGWMVVMAALLPLETALTGRLVAGGAARFALVLALGGFLATFFRRSFKPGRLEAAACLLLAAFGAVGWLLPAEEFRTQGLGGAFQSWAAAVVLAYAAVYGAFTLGPLPPKRQRYAALMAATCLGAAVGFALEGRFGGDGAERLPMMSHLLVAVFALFLVADLVIFHSSHFREKASRVEQEQAATEREARQVLGRSVQHLLLPQEREGRFGAFAYAFDFASTAAHDGDWIFSWDIGAERRFLCGHVAGKGARVVLGVAAVVGFLHEARERRLSLEDAARFLNKRLLDLFDRQVTSTLQAVSLAHDGSVELFACGGPGFFQVSREGIRHYQMSSTPLGVAVALETAACPIALDDEDVLLGGTEGALDEDRTQRLVDHYEEHLDHEQSLDAVRGVVLKLAPARAELDHTLLLVQRCAA